jgi:membrane protein
VSEQKSQSDVESLALRPIRGVVIDPPPKSYQDVLQKFDDRSKAAGFGYRSFTRFIYSEATLLAAGTTYYVFLSVFALVAFGYGIASWFGADNLSDSITRGLTEAFPGLTGEDGFDTDALRTAGQTASFIGLLVMLYSGSGAMYASSRSLHRIYGAPKDPRNYAWARIRLGGWLLLLAPMVLASYLLSGTLAGLTDSVLTALGFERIGADALVVTVGLAVSLALDFAIAFLIFGHLGGIRPPLGPRLVGSALSAIAIEALKHLMSFVIAFSISNPIYGAFATPITMLLVFYLQVMATFLGASVIAGMSEATDTDPDAGETPRTPSPSSSSSSSSSPSPSPSPSPESATVGPTDSPQ